MLSLYYLFPAVALCWYIGSTVYGLHRNYKRALLSGLPVIVTPISGTAFPWIVLKEPLLPLLKRILPAGIYDRLRLTAHSWEFEDRYELHGRVGPAFVLCSPTSNELWCADPSMAQIVLTRRKDFVQMPLATKIMGILGENLLSSDGEVWARQRRLVAPNLNERISEVVWQETQEQSNQMVDHLIAQPHSQAKNVQGACRSITINVLGRVAYGKPKAFAPFMQPTNEGDVRNYVDAIALISDQIHLAGIFPARFLSLPFMPKVARTLGAVMKKTPGLTRDLLDQERDRLTNHYDGRDTLLTMLVRLLDEAQGTEDKPKESSQYLSVDEVSGNLFVFTVAGFDTTATVLNYAVALLAVNPEIQAWIQEEIDEVTSLNPGGGMDDYESNFPKLTRCLAILMETLRLYPPVPHITRSTMSTQTIKVNNRQHDLIGPYTVFINTVSLSCAPQTWGLDSYEWKPSRWIVKSGDGARDELYTPPRGTFTPWSTGPRVCPGMKMAQVEFVSVLATIFSRCSVEPVEEKGQTMAEARRELFEMTREATPRMTLQMTRQEDVHLRWKVR